MLKGLFGGKATSARILRRYSVSATVGLGGFGDFERWMVGNFGVGREAWPWDTTWGEFSWFDEKVMLGCVERDGGRCVGSIKRVWSDDTLLFGGLTFVDVEVEGAECDFCMRGVSSTSLSLMIPTPSELRSTERVL